jgi:hypothetical protein
MVPKRYKDIQQLKKKLRCLRSPDPAKRVNCYKQFCKENHIQEIKREIKQLESDHSIEYEAIYTRLLAVYIVNLSNRTYRDLSGVTEMVGKKSYAISSSETYYDCCHSAWRKCRIEIKIKGNGNDEKTD